MLPTIQKEMARLLVKAKRIHKLHSSDRRISYTGDKLALLYMEEAIEDNAAYTDSKMWLDRLSIVVEAIRKHATQEQIEMLVEELQGFLDD